MTAAPLRLAHLPTPLEPMDRLADALAPAGGGPRLLVKRDDCTGLALGGNKARKLERLCAEAIAQGCDVLVTGGGTQSNHVRMTAAAANRLGLDCHVALAVSERSGTSDSGNVLLDGILGVHAHPLVDADYYELEAGIEELGAELTRQGRRPYVIPIGGASVTGAVAYVDAADELVAQLDGARVDHVVVADGSGGTHAGLLAGLPREVHVLGVDVGTRPDLDDTVPRLASVAAARAGRATPPGEVSIDHDHFGSGYGAVTDDAFEAITLAARCEGLVLDPVYTGKAMAALVSAVREGRIAADETALFW
ncbi:MAG TPA: D-cysteine desulfhydrase family protein, partial [Solirubrobacterales bacterium]|nr:D-cysteine desulfhydrase family protein [Solirubrobacterales bacterium]